MRIALSVMAIMLVFFVYLICRCLFLLRKLDAAPMRAKGITKQMELQLAIAVAFELERLFQKGAQITVRTGAIIGWLLYITFLVSL